MPYNGSAPLPQSDLSSFFDAYESRLQKTEESIQLLVRTTAVQAEKIDNLVESLNRFVNSVESNRQTNTKSAQDLVLRIHDLEGAEKRRAGALKTQMWIWGTILAGVVSDLAVHVLEHIKF